MNTVELFFGFIIIYVGNLLGLLYLGISDPFMVAFVCSAAAILVWIVCGIVGSKMTKKKSND